MKGNKRVSFKLIAMLLVITLVVQIITIHSKATASDYSLSDKTVVLDGENDGTVEVNLVTQAGGSFSGLEASWTKSEVDKTTHVAPSQKYFTLSNLTAGGTTSPDPMENSASTGRVVWTDSSFTGFSVSPQGAVWKATYTVDKDTPAGKYYVGLSIDAITGGTSGNDSDEDIQLTAEITVERDEPFAGTFVTGAGVSGIDIYYSQSYESDSTVPADETGVTKAYPRNGATGAEDQTGSGQINFKVNLEDNYLLNADDITITYDGDTKPYNSLQNVTSSGSTTIGQMYRITQITDNITINVTPRARTSIVPDISGVEVDYEYTGSSIEPDVTVKIHGTETTLTKGVDYTVGYGTNTELGQGTVYIHPVDISQYYFNDSETYVNFNIVAKELTADNVTVPASMTYTGSSLTPSVIVTANGRTLVQDTDYTVSFSNQDGAANENIVVTVEGKGNYKTTTPIEKNVLITPKPSRAIDDREDIELSYGESRAFSDTADCEVTYVSSNPGIVSVAHSKSGNNSSNTLNAIGVGSSVITVKYAETSTYAETTTTFTVTVNKAELSITGATISNKKYDGATSASVSAVTFNNSNINFTKGTDYTATASFDDANVGTNKPVTVTVNLIGDAANRYVLTSNSCNGTANITQETIASSNIMIDDSGVVYDGTAKEPAVTVEINGRTLTKNTDYTVEYSNNVNAGTATATITGRGNYKTVSPVEAEFTISAKEITPVIANIPDVVFNMEQQKPELTVTCGSTTLIKGTDYTVDYSNNTNAGSNTATATITKIRGGNYSFDDVSKTFTIKPYTIVDSDVALGYTTIRHDGTAKEPTVTVTLNGNTVNSSNYSVAYSNNTDVGEATVTVTATGSNYDTTAQPVEKTFTILDKEVLAISGIANNQSKTYTGNKVVLSGTLAVGENNNNIKVSDLTTTWYNSLGEEIEQPTEVGSYSVKYSYSDVDYAGDLTVNFEITKKTSATPAEVTNGLTANEGQTLANVSLSTTGLSWVNGETPIVAGNNTYPATYTQNNDTKNYTTETVNIPVYGKKYIDITTSVNGVGGAISASVNHVLEGTSKTITLTPEEGYEVAKVTVNGVEKSVANNSLTVTAGTEDLQVIAYFKVIQYTITITANNATADPNGIISVNYNANQDITISANFGYNLTSVLVGNVEKIGELENGVLKLSNIKANQVITITAKKITYNYTEGAEQTYLVEKNSTATFKIDADYSLFSNLFVDGNLVDKSKYTVKSGSTIVTLSEAFMDTLTEGTHTIKVAFTNGGEAVTTFEVASENSKSQSNDETSSNSDEISETASDESSTSKTGTSNGAKTGDKVVKYFVYATVATLGILIMTKSRKKRSSRR